MLAPYYADLHVHIGRTASGSPVKISASRDLTFERIVKEASGRKGLDLLGIIDCQSPAVQVDIERMLASGEMREIPGGGIRYGRTTVLLGSEIEVREEGLGPAHLLVYLPTFAAMRDFTGWLAGRMKNVGLSSQRLRASARMLQEEATARGGVVIPAHIFTPHKSLYGSCVSRMEELLDPGRVAAVELGLSADSAMACSLSELDGFAFLSNSDAHSPGKIGREYNVMELAEPSFAEWVKALAGKDGRRIAANYGLDPRLGKYHRTYCPSCGILAGDGAAFATGCPHCGSARVVLGVRDRIRSIADRSPESAEAIAKTNRPPYRYQVPLEFIPGVGPKTLQALLDRFGTEMNVLHRASPEELSETVGAETAAAIVRARTGELPLVAGGGGVYGRVKY